MSEDRPFPRSVCRDMPRPCPHFNCRQHLVVTAKGGSLVHIGGRKHGSKTLAVKASKKRFGEWSETALELLETAPETCALDVAERGGATYQEIADLLGVSKQRVEQVCQRAMRKLAMGGEADA